MQNIEEMRKKYEEEIRLAELGNKIETEHPEFGHNELQPHVYAGWKGDARGYFTKGNGGINDRLTEEDAGMILSILPIDEQIRVYQGNKNGYVMANYSMRVHAAPSHLDPCTYLEIEWKSGGVEWNIKLKIDEDCKIWDWFRLEERALSDSEISSYSIQKNRYTKEYREHFRYYSFAYGNIIRYQGGYDQQTADSVIHGIIDKLIYNYQYKED